MDLSVSKKKTALAIGGLLALTVGAGSIQANTSYLSSSATAAAAITVPGVTCSTVNGPPSTGQSFTVHAFGAPTGYSIVVGVVPIAGLKVTPPAAVTLTSANNAAGITFTVNSTAGCSNANGITANTLASGANTITLQLTVALNGGSAGNDNSATVTDTITAASSALVVAPVTITCGYNATGPVYVPGAPQTVSVSSAANLGTPFSAQAGTVAAGVFTSGSLPSWLQLTPIAPAGTAGTTAVNFTVQATANCGGFAGVDTSYALPLLSAPAPTITVLISLKHTTLSPLTVMPVPSTPSIMMTYVLNSNTPQSTTVNVTSSISTSSSQTFYQVNNLPIWLTVNHSSGYIPMTTGTNLTFTTTNSANSLPPGNYTATVFLAVSQYADQPVVINLLVTNAPPKLSVTTPNPQPVTYTLGGATPVTTITVASNDSPIPYSISFGGPLAPMLTAGEQSTGIAYSFGSSIQVTYNPLLFQTSAPGTVLSGTVTFTWGSSNSVIVVTINLTVASQAATLTSISPASLPTAAPGSAFYVTLTGNGFVGGTDPTVATRVGIVSGSSVVPDTNFALTYVNSSNLLLKITVPALAGAQNGDANLPFLVGGGGGPVYLGIVNGTASSTPTGTATLTIGGGPIIYGVTSSSSFTEVSGGTLPSLAPYDMVSIFGANFCSSQATFPAVGQVAAYTNGGCGSTTILPGTPTAGSNWIFPFSLTPDQYITPTPPASALWRYLTVNFYALGSNTAIPAPLLFATNGQINTIVPGQLTAGQTYNVVVSFGCATCTPSTVVSSTAFPVSIVATDPGIFAIGADGQGPAAALAASTYALIGASNPAGMRYSATDSDTVLIYMTGLGVPDSAAAYSTDDNSCIAPLGGGYLTALNASVIPNLTLINIDGAVLQDNLFAGDRPPCLTTEPTVTIGGVATPVLTYAGFTGDTVAGLYQINVPLPSTQNTFYPNWPATTSPIVDLAAPAQLPVFVTVGGHTSQAGVMLAVAPKLTMTIEGLTGISPVTAASNAAAAVLTTAAAPATGTVVLISGFTGAWAPANGFQSVTHLSATTFSIAVNSTAYGVMTGIPVFALPSAMTGVTENLSIGHAMTPTTIVGNWNNSHAGVTYAITAGVLPEGLSLTSASNIATITGTPAQGTAGTYPITITATNSSAIPITGSVSFTYYVPGGLFVTATGATASTHGTANAAISTVTAVGGTAPYNNFAITSTAIAGLTITNGGVLQTDGTTPAGAYTVTVTATDSAGLTGTINISFTVNLELSMAPQSPISQLASYGSALTTVTVSGGSGSYTCSVDPSSTFPTAADLSFTGCALYVGTAVAGGPGTVVIDVVDNGAAPTGGSNPPQAQITLNSLTLN